MVLLPLLRSMPTKLTSKETNLYTKQTNDSKKATNRHLQNKFN